MLSSITLKFTEHQDLVLPASGITIFVGPNNSGKSLVLKEIESAFNTHPFPANTLMLRDYEVEWKDDTEIDADLAKFEQYKGANAPIGHRTIGRINPNGGREAATINLENLKNWTVLSSLCRSTGLLSQPQG